MAKCDVQWCRSGQPATVSVLENLDDGSWRIRICKACADAFGAKKGDDLMSEPIFSRTRAAARAARSEKQNAEHG